LRKRNWQGAASAAVSAAQNESPGRLCGCELVSGAHLAIEVGDINRVQIDDLNIGETGQHQVFQQLAANPARSHNQHLQMRRGSNSERERERETVSHRID
jgi:hypothetical protein